MQNYEAIIKMTPEQMEFFLDEVYCTGLNTGLYAARLDEETAGDILGENPFSFEWLAEDAEPALLPVEDDAEGKECLNALCDILLRNAGINPDEITEEL